MRVRRSGEGPWGRVRAITGSLAFLALAPGTVAVLLPRWITGWRLPTTASWYVPLQVVGIALGVLASVALVGEFARFAWQGRGTPAPVAPTQVLVVTGLYRYVRNPMYVSVDTLLIGQVLVFASLPLLGYTVVAAALMAGFARWYEEPALRRRHGNLYETYRSGVPGWIPGRPARPHPGPGPWDSRRPP
jgi:protein-S-isoprenylcysteine O-methyltransferase Ste14